MSLGTTGLRNISPVLVSVIPHVAILAAFGGFVVWNNGVVLGKSEIPSVVCAETHIHRTQRIPQCRFASASDALHLALLLVLFLAHPCRSRGQCGSSKGLPPYDFELRVSKETEGLPSSLDYRCSDPSHPGSDSFQYHCPSVYSCR